MASPLILFASRENLPITVQVPIPFETILQSATLPEPGPELYAARRAIWLTPRVTPREPVMTASKKRLDALLSPPGAVFKKEIWNNGLDKFWRGLCSGGQLKHRLSMSLIVKVVHAQWVRDETWPSGREAPADTDDENNTEPQPTTSTPPTHSLDSGIY